MVRYRYIVSGRVQGVGFRYHVQRQAGGLHLTGFVRNLENGDVQIEVQGEPEPIRAFRHAFEYDIPFARVTAVTTEAMEPLPEERSFRVKY